MLRPQVERIDLLPSRGVLHERVSVPVGHLVSSGVLHGHRNVAGAEVELPHSEEPVDDDADDNEWLVHPCVVDEGDKREKGRDVVASVEVHAAHNDEENMERDDGQNKGQEERMVLAPNAVSNPNTVMILKTNKQ